MAITNGYATLAQFKSLKTITSTDATDDTLIEELITRASRACDGLTGQWFYGATQTRLFDVPEYRELKLDAPLLTVTTLTNGDGTVIASTEYNLWPINGPSHRSLKLKELSTTWWQPSTIYGREAVISVAGSWGYVSRVATDPESVAIITGTETATLQIALNWYLERKGNAQGQVQVTAAGVVITPYGAIPKTAWELLMPYRTRL